MVVHVTDRRVSHRLQYKTALRVRSWKCASNEQGAESEDLSETGIFFASNVPLTVGTAVQILLTMPEEITGNPTTEWCCTGHVVRLEALDSPQGKLGVGVQFDCYEILRSKTAAST
jgi:hypothetical protein